MPRQKKPQRPVDCVLYPDACGHGCLRHRKSVVTQLQRRRGIEKVQSVMGRACQPERKAESAWARGELPDSSIGRKSPVLSHVRNAEIANRLKRAQQNAPGLPLRLTGNIHAEISSVDGINIRVTSRAEQHLIAGGGAAMRVRGRIGRVVVRAKIGFDLSNPANYRARVGPADKQLPEQPRGDVLGLKFEEKALHKIAGRFARTVYAGSRGAWGFFTCPLRF